MKNVTKRIISLILSMVMAACCVAIASANETNSSFKEGQIIEFGSYPQTKIVDETIISNLNAIEATEYSYNGYYESTPLNNMGTMKFEENDYMMHYKDVEYDGDRYRGVKINSYRPWRTNTMSDKNYSWQDDHGFEKGTWYWFKYEPLKWIIFDSEKGLAICDRIIDSQPFNSTYTYGSDGYSNYGTYFSFSNNFGGSQLCDWLNNDFLTTAFTADEQNEIPETTVDTCFADGSCGSKRGAAVSRKVVLLTYNQALDSEAPEDDGYTEIVKDIFVSEHNSTDYANIQGNEYSGVWWLTTPSYGDTLSVMCAYPPYRMTPASISSGQIMCTSYGVRPVIAFEGNTLVESTQTEATQGETSQEEAKDTENNENKNGTNTILIACGVAIAAAVGIAIPSAVVIKKKNLNK